VKTSLDPEDSIESIENDKNIPLHLKLRKIHICAFALLKFSKSGVNAKNAHRIQFSRPIRFLRFDERRNSRKTGSVRKNSIRAISVGKIRGPKLEIGKI